VRGRLSLDGPTVGPRLSVFLKVCPAVQCPVAKCQ